VTNNPRPGDRIFSYMLLVGMGLGLLVFAALAVKLWRIALA
jgi:hypothetical protein